MGDRFTGKVVKTTAFGAFVELTKGTDGLLHISNVKPGERVSAVEDVLKQGDELDVTVVEVDRERGRIGLRLSSDPAVEGKALEELSSVGTGDSGPRGGGNGGAAGVTESAWTVGAGEAAVAGAGDGPELLRSAPHQVPCLSPAPSRCRRASPARSCPVGCGWSPRLCPRCARSRSGFWVRTGSRDEAPAQAGVSHFLEHLLFKGTERHSAIEISELFDGMGAADQRSHQQGVDTTACAAPGRAHRGGLRPARRDAAPALAARGRGGFRARGRAGGDRHVRGRAPGPGARRARGRRPRRPSRWGAGCWATPR